MSITDDKITEIFYLADDFCKKFYSFLDNQSLTDNTRKKIVRKKPILSHSEIITIMIMFHYGAFRNFKHFYLLYVQKHLQSYFPKTVSYNRFVELEKEIVTPLALFIKNYCYPVKLFRSNMCKGKYP